MVLPNLAMGILRGLNTKNGKLSRSGNHKSLISVAAIIIIAVVVVVIVVQLLLLPLPDLQQAVHARRSHGSNNNNIK